MARISMDSPLVYVGDIVSDGEACKVAIERGATNIRFLGISHPQAFNTERAMDSFVNANPSFAQKLKRLDDIGVIWS